MMLSLQLGLFVAGISLVIATDLIAQCPGEKYPNGQPSKVTCLVNRTYYDNKCILVPFAVTFTYLRNNRKHLFLCKTNYTHCLDEGSQHQYCKGCFCRCVKRNDTTMIDEYLLTVSSSTPLMQGGTLACNITCDPGYGDRYPTTDFTGCPNTEGLKTGQSAEQAGSNTGMYAGLTTGAIVLVIGGTVAAVYYKKMSSDEQETAPDARPPQSPGLSDAAASPAASPAAVAVGPTGN